MATHSGILAWKTPWTEEPGRLQFLGSKRVRYDFETEKKNKKQGVPSVLAHKLRVLTSYRS